MVVVAVAVAAAAAAAVTPAAASRIFKSAGQGRQLTVIGDSVGRSTSIEKFYNLIRQHGHDARES